MTSLRWVLALAVAGSLGCGESRSLEGTWTGNDLMGNQMTFVFGEDGRAEWVLQQVTPGGGTMASDTIRMAYTTDTSAEPATIDFFDFDFGPLQGTTTYGIYEFTEGDAFRIDLEPAGPGQDASVRPDSFSSETVTFTRAGGEE
ncbi:MAG TPA: hypothetical protein VFQ21_10970 [Gemmatimonadota bacterium]|nr:hypothetical protein [Gemmatimonadota bacterium]